MGRLIVAVTTTDGYKLFIDSGMTSTVQYLINHGKMLHQTIYKHHTYLISTVAAIDGSPHDFQRGKNDQGVDN